MSTHKIKICKTPGCDKHIVFRNGLPVSKWCPNCTYKRNYAKARLNPKNKIKKPKTPQQSLKSQCNDLWTECIKARAGYTSELSGVKGKKVGGLAIITAHHILGKANNRLRFELENGICLINGKEHIFGVHNNSPLISKKYQDLIIKKIGKKRYEYLQSLVNIKTEKRDLGSLKLYLRQRLITFEIKLERS